MKYFILALLSSLVAIPGYASESDPNCVTLNIDQQLTQASGRQVLEMIQAGYAGPMVTHNGQTNQAYGDYAFDPGKSTVCDTPSWKTTDTKSFTAGAQTKSSCTFTYANSSWTITPSKDECCTASGTTARYHNKTPYGALCPPV